MSIRRNTAATRRLAKIISLLEAAYGRPEETRWKSGDVVGSLVRTILSQNTTDTNSGRAYRRLRERYDDWDSVRRARVSSIASVIRGGGLADTKARRIKGILTEIHRERGGIDLEFLREGTAAEAIDYLERFEGVGPKTAACVALFELGRDVMPVDTHVHRVLGRIGIVGITRGPEQTYEAVAPLVPDGDAHSLHVNLIRLGRRLCRPRDPRCAECPIARECDAGRGRSKGSRGSTTGTGRR